MIAEAYIANRTPMVELGRSISYRELSAVLTESGSPVTVGELHRWRKGGLLPSPDCNGTGKRRTPSWRDQDIVCRARTIQYLLSRDDRLDTAIRALWLCGFKVPLPRLRRAWQHHASQPRRWSFKPRVRHEADTASQRQNSGKSLSNVTLGIVISLIGSLASLDPSEDIAAAIAGQVFTAFAKKAGLHDEAQALFDRQTLVLIRIVTSILESTNLLKTSSDAQLAEAQDYLKQFAPFIQNCVESAPPELLPHQAPLWSPDLARHIGEPLYILIIALLRSGQRYLLDRIALAVETCEKPVIAGESTATTFAKIAVDSSGRTAAWNA